MAQFHSGRFAAIDIGTVTSRMLVADVSGTLEAPELSEVLRMREMTNLGEGVDATQRLSYAAIERTVSAVDSFLNELSALDSEVEVEGLSVMATSASRDATNSEDFIRELSRIGVSLDIIPGSMEASLSFAGATAKHGSGDVAVVDVGGGSTEISFGIAAKRPITSHSFNVGCRRATERFLKTSPPVAGSLLEMREWAASQFKEWVDAQRQAFSGDLHVNEVIAVAGTATSAIAMRDSIVPYDATLVDGATMTLGELDELTEKIATLTLDEIERLPGLDPRRAPVIVGGLAILSEAIRAIGAESFIASEDDILEGMIMYNAKTFESRVDKARWKR